LIKSKAIDLLKALSKKEFKEFGDFVRSPFFNKNPKQVQLYEILKKHHSHFSSPELTKEYLYEKLFPGKKFRDNEIRRNLSELLKLGEEYLSHLNINRTEQFVKKKSLLHELGKRKLDNLFDSAFNEIYEKYGEVKDLGDDYFVRNFDIQVIKTNHDQDRLPSRESRDITINNLLNCFKYLMCFSLITTLKLNQDFIAMHINYNFDYKNTVAYKYLERLNMPDFLEDLKQYDKNLHDILKIYYTHFLVMSGFDADDSHYWELKKLVEENLYQFSRFEKYNLMLFLETCASLKIRDGKKSFVQEIHEIHKYMLGKNLYESSDSNYMHMVRFWKIVNNALTLKKFDWAENFINEYAPKLHPDSIEHMKNYTYSLLSFAKGDYEKSLEQVSKVKSYDFNISFNTKALKLKCFYELGYFEEIFYSLDSIKHSLKKDTASPDWAKSRFLNFINYFERLVKLKINESVEESETELLKDQLHKGGEMYEEQWLEEKLEELLQGIFKVYKV
jgi:hypothetical protein